MWKFCKGNSYSIIMLFFTLVVNEKKNTYSNQRSKRESKPDR